MSWPMVGLSLAVVNGIIVIRKNTGHEAFCSNSLFVFIAIA